MLEYVDFKELYPTSELTEDKFKTMCSNFNTEVLSLISEWFTFDELYTRDSNLKLMVARQILSVESTGEYFDGISSQTSSNTSVTYSSGFQLGDYMWNQTVRKYITRKYGIRYITC